jgi:hypothetical protein
VFLNIAKNFFCLSAAYYAYAEAWTLVNLCLGFPGKAVTVLDPYMQGCHDSKLELEHAGTVDALHEALFDCKDAWFLGWDVERTNWDYKYDNALGRHCRE